jgi:HAD superfamily hydrolase (TIGR01450 family)
MNYKVLILDLDGTVYTDGKPIKNIIHQLNAFTTAGNKIFYLSNNTSVSVSHYLDKLTKLGLVVSIEEIITPTIIAGIFLRANYNKGYMVGTSSFLAEMQGKYMLEQDTLNPEFVLLSFDREITYDKFMLACKFLNQDIPYYITHIDLACPSEFGPIPDCGSLSLVLETVTGRKPLEHFGKPSDRMVEFISNLIQDYAPDEVLMAGDRLYTDILLGNKLGVQTLVVLSGETKMDHVERNTDFRLSHCAHTLSEYLDGQDLIQVS